MATGYEDREIGLIWLAVCLVYPAVRVVLTAHNVATKSYYEVVRWWRVHYPLSQLNDDGLWCLRSSDETAKQRSLGDTLRGGCIMW